MPHCWSKNLKNKQNRERQLEYFTTSLGFSFRQPELLAEALVHSSYAHEHAKTAMPHNERLEFLGDAVLDLAISERLFRAIPNLNEGLMTQARAAVVCEKSLAAVAQQLHPGDFLLLGCGERSRDGKYPASILADALEAVIGAIYLDGGLEPVQRFIDRFLGAELLRAQQGSIIQDYKTQLQQELQKEGPRAIAYQLISQTGPPHDRTFAVEVWVDGEVFGSGSGKSKKEAEQVAAQAALTTLE